MVDMTELEGVYDVDLEWSVDDVTGRESDSTPSLSTVLQEKLGLRLDSRKTPVDLYESIMWIAFRPRTDEDQLAQCLAFRA